MIDLRYVWPEWSSTMEHYFYLWTVKRLSDDLLITLTRLLEKQIHPKKKPLW